MKRTIFLPAIIALLSFGLLLYKVAFDPFFMGLWINRFIPCESSIENSFPCFGIYDIYATLFLVAIGVIATIVALLQALHIHRKR